MKKLCKGLGFGILISIAALAIECVVGIGFEVVYFIAVGIRAGLDGADPSDFSTLIEKAMKGDIILLVTVIGIIACGIVFFFWYRREIKGEARGSLKKIITGKNIIMLLILGIGMQLFISGIMSIAQQYFTKIFDDYAKQMEILTDGNIILVAILTVVIAPFTEELIFRGVILHRVNRYVSFLAANIIQAILFGIYHFNIVQGIYASFIGLLLGGVYYKFRSIYACMFLHMTINASSFLVSVFPDKSFIYYIFIVIGGTALFAGLFLLKKTEKLVPDAINTEPEYGEPAYDNDKTGTWNAQ